MMLVRNDTWKGVNEGETIELFPCLDIVLLRWMGLRDSYLCRLR